MLVGCWFVVVIQIICFKGDSFCDAHLNSKCIEVQRIGKKIKNSPAATYNFNPATLQFHMLGLSIENIQITPFFKKKDLQRGYNLLRIHFNSKFFNTIARLLPGNPMVNNHWICRIQV
jgi:hypothetical protein